MTELGQDIAKSRKSKMCSSGSGYCRLGIHLTTHFELLELKWNYIALGAI